MAVFDADRPWLNIETLVERKDSEALREYLDSLTPFDVARATSRMGPDRQAEFLRLLEPGEAADLLEELSDTQGSDIIEDLPVSQAAAIVEEMESDHRADVLGEMDTGDAEAILREMDPEEAQDARKLLTYEDDVAGGLMITEFVTYPQQLLARDVLNDLRENAERYSEIGVQYAYVESERGTLVGVLRLRDLVLAPGESPLPSIMVVNPIYVEARTPLDELDNIFERYGFMRLPVTDEESRLIGVVRRADVEEARSERTEKTFMRYSGIIRGNELRNMAFADRAVRRLMWLVINLGLSALAASVILLFEGTIIKITALAAILPVIGNMSGCAGNQAVAVSIRELTLGIVKPQDFLHVFRKEVEVAVLNGVCIGALLGVAIGFYKGDPGLGIAVGAALGINTLIAAGVGGVTPLALNHLKLDPALAAAPILMTIVDMCGFFLVLMFARAALG